MVLFNKEFVFFYDLLSLIDLFFFLFYLALVGVTFWRSRQGELIWLFIVFWEQSFGLVFFLEENSG